MRPLELNMRIGLFVFIAIILLTLITFSIGDFLFKTGYEIDVILNFANGVQDAAPVRLAGIEVGEVKEAVAFKDETGKTKARLRLWITKDAEVEKDSKVLVNTLGLIGEKYVEIIPGTPGSPLLKNGDVIKGEDSISVEQMTKKGYDIALKMEKAIDSLEYILNEIKDGRGTIGRLVSDDELYNDLDDLVKDLKANPWKLFQRPARSRKRTKDDSKEGNKGIF